MTVATLGQPVWLVRARRDLGYLMDAWPLLVELRIPGTRRRWTDRGLRRLSRLGDEEVKLGASPAPLDISILDLLAQMAASADEMCRLACESLDSDGAGGFVQSRYEKMASAWLDPREHLGFVRAWLGQVAEIDEATAAVILDRVRKLVGPVAACLGEASDGQVLAAICPWCGGRTETAPVGGERTLTIHLPDGAVSEFDEPVIICHGVNCTPSEADCGLRDRRGRPGWPWREWDWLADRLLPIGDCVHGERRAG